MFMIILFFRSYICSTISALSTFFYAKTFLICNSFFFILCVYVCVRMGECVRNTLEYKDMVMTEENELTTLVTNLIIS